MTKSWRDNFNYPVKALQKEIGWSDSKVEYLVASGQINVEKDVNGEYYTCWADAYYYLTLPHSYRQEQVQDTRDYSPLLEVMRFVNS